MRMKKILMIVGTVVLILFLSCYFAWMTRSKVVTWEGKEYTTEAQISEDIEAIRRQKITVEGDADSYDIAVTSFLDASAKDVYNKMHKELKKHWLKSVLHQQIVLDYELNFEKSSLDKVIKEIADKEGTTPKDSTYTFDNKKVYIVNGHDGVKVNEETLYNDIISAVKNKDFTEVVRINYDVAEFKAVNSEEIAAKVAKPAVDAKIEEKDGITQVIKASEGIMLSKQEQETIDKNCKTPDFEFSVPLEKVKPEVTEVDTSGLFTDVMGSYDTSFTGSDAGRANNVTKATNFINGVILNPGEEFSYCDTVGRTTLERGFSYATVYENGKAVKGVGGGLCQVSTTLYNAVLLSDLEVTQRQNHSLPVHYAPMGRDATVSYGVIDFKFKNNYNYPIMIVGSTAGKHCNIKIMGKATGKEVTLTNKMISNSGGYQTWYLYKTVKQNGAIIEDNVLESKSTYKV